MPGNGKTKLNSSTVAAGAAAIGATIITGQSNIWIGVLGGGALGIIAGLVWSRINKSKA